MRRYLPIVVALVAVAGLFIYVELSKKSTSELIEGLSRPKNCSKPPQFFDNPKVARSVVIDLSQQRFKGIAFIHGQDSLYSKQWGQYGHFGTYALSDSGDIYLAPMPFISIKENTFDLQKNLYKLDSKSAKLSVFMHFDSVEPARSNPFGIISVLFDCQDRSLWVSAIDKSSYSTQAGRVMHVDLESREVIDQIDGFDAFTITLADTDHGRVLLAGSAYEPSLYAIPIDSADQKPIKLFDLLDSNKRIRKIKIIDRDKLLLQVVDFSYSLVAMSSDRYREEYVASYSGSGSWHIDLY